MSKATIEPDDGECRDCNGDGCSECPSDYPGWRRCHKCDDPSEHGGVEICHPLLEAPVYLCQDTDLIWVLDCLEGIRSQEESRARCAPKATPELMIGPRLHESIVAARKEHERRFYGDSERNIRRSQVVEITRGRRTLGDELQARLPQSCVMSPAKKSTVQANPQVCGDTAAVAEPGSGTVPSASGPGSLSPEERAAKIKALDRKFVVYDDLKGMGVEPLIAGELVSLLESTVPDHVKVSTAWTVLQLGGHWGDLPMLGRWLRGHGYSIAIPRTRRNISYPEGGS